MNGGGLPALPQGWTWASLESCCQKLTDGAHYTPKYVSEGYPFVTITDVEDERIVFGSAKLIGKEAFEKLRSNCNPHEGDVLFSKDGTVGKTVEIDFERDFIVLSSLAILRPYHEVLIPRYLKYVLKSSLAFEQYDKMKTGTALTRVILRNLKKIKIPIAPVNEQRRIDAKVEALLAESKTAREALDKVPGLLRRFRQSVLAKAFRGELTQRDPNGEPAQSLLQKMEQEEIRQQTKTLVESKPRFDDFPRLPDTWVWVKLGKIANIVGGGTPRRDTPEYYKNGTIPWATPTDINPNGILTIFETAEKITEKALAKSSAKLLPTGTVLFSSRASIGKIAIAGRALTTNQGFANVIPTPLLDSRYLAYGLRHFAKDIERLGSGTTYIEVAKSSLKEFYFPLAPLKEQRRVAAKIQELYSFADSIEAAIKKAKERTGMIDQAILAKAFRGELVPQDPNDEPASVLLQRIKSTTGQLGSFQTKSAN